MPLETLILKKNCTKQEYQPEKKKQSGFIPRIAQSKLCSCAGLFSHHKAWGKERWMSMIK